MDNPSRTSDKRSSLEFNVQAISYHISQFRCGRLFCGFETRFVLWYSPLAIMFPSWASQIRRQRKTMTPKEGEWKDTLIGFDRIIRWTSMHESLLWIIKLWNMLCCDKRNSLLSPDLTMRAIFSISFLKSILIGRSVSSEAEVHFDRISLNLQFLFIVEIFIEIGREGYMDRVRVGQWRGWSDHIQLHLDWRADALTRSEFCGLQTEKSWTSFRGTLLIIGFIHCHRPKIQEQRIDRTCLISLVSSLMFISVKNMEYRFGACRKDHS
jgi:hypothetical protein